MSKMKSVHVNVDHTYTIMIVILDNEIDGGHDYSHLSISVLKCGPALWFFNKKNILPTSLSLYQTICLKK